MANEIDPFAPNSTTSYGDPALDAFFRVGDYAPAPPEAPQGVADIEQYMPRKEPTKYEPKGITSGILSDPDYLRYLEAVEQKQKIPTGLLQAIIAKESSGNPNAVSPADAQGLHGWGAGQFRNSTAKDVASRTGIPIWQNGKVNMDPYVQAEAMAALLQMKRQAVGGDWGDAAWAYNAGEGNVLSYKQGKGYSQYADRVDPRYKDEVLANRDAVLQLRGSQATPAATQPQEAQPETYDIPLSDGSILHAPVGMSREEALKQAKEAGLAAEGLRDIPLASGAILHAPESMSDEDAIAQAKAAAPDMDFTTIHESKTGFVPGFKSAVTGLGSQVLRGAGEMAQGAAESFNMPKVKAIGEEAIAKSKELEAKAAGMAEKPTEKDSAFTRYFSQPAGEVTGSVLPLVAGAAVAPEVTVPALLGGTLTSQVIGSQAQRGEAAGKGDYDISENLPYSIPEIGINYAANVLGPLKSVFKSRLADELLSADADKLIRNIAKTEGFDAAKEAVGSKISNIAQEYGVNLGSMAFGDISSAILERASAGEELTSPDAMEEYWNNFTTDLVGAGLFGAPQGIGRRAAKEAAVDKLGAELRGAAPYPRVPSEGTRLKAEEATAKRLAEEQQPPTGEQQPPTGEQLPPTGEQQPPTGEQQPPTGEQQPPTGEQQPPTGVQFPAPEGTAWQDTLGLTKSKAPGSIYNRLLQLDIEDPEHYTYIKSILDEIGKKPGIKHDSQAIENLYNYIGAKPTEEMVKARKEFAGKMGFEVGKEIDQTGRITAPLFAAKSEALKKGVDAKDVPATLTALGQSKNPIIRWVAEKAANIPNLTVRSDDSAIGKAEKQLRYPKGSIGGYYNSGTDELVMRSVYANSEHVVGHELLHGLTARTINNISAKLKANIALDKTEKKQLPAYNGLVKLYDAVKTHPTLAKDYGARQNVKEFVSEGLSNPEFQYKLSRIKYENTTMWGKFTQSLANMLGLKRDNAFMELVTHVENLAPKKPTKPKAKAITPSRIEPTEAPVSREGMHFKDVTKRTPELQQGMAQLKAGEITKEQYNELVNKYKPVTSYKDIPTPVTEEEARYALSTGKSQTEAKAAKFGLPSQNLTKGEYAQVRLDIPSYTNHGAWVVAVHTPDSVTGRDSDFGAGTVVGYAPVASVTDVRFGMKESKAADIAGGKSKSPIATILGKWNPMTSEQAYKRAKEVLNDPAWTQVGMDPERHSYFYDRETMEPVTHADEVIQIGPLVLAKNATTDRAKYDFEFMVQEPEKARADKDTQTAKTDAGSRAQPQVRQEGEGAPVSGEGVREGRQEGRATEKVEVDKTPPRLGAPTPKEELTERAIKRVLHREKTGEDIWVPGLGNKQVQATIRKLLTQRDSGEITEEQMHGRLNSLLDQITLKSEERKFTEKDRVRGADFIRQRLLEAKRKGLLSERAVDMAEWFIKKNPKLLDDLGISTKTETPKDMEGTAGYYTKLNRVMTLISENVKDSTAVHEILHHLERMMPSNIRAGISKAWLKSVMDAKKKAEKAGDEKLVSFLNATLTGDQKLIKETFRKLSREQALDQYHHFNPSEFWAVNGTRILENRYDSSPAFLKRLATWLREFGQHVKGALGLKSDAPILRAIDVMLKEKTPEYRSQRLLGEEVGRKQMTLAASYVGEKPKDLIVKTETSEEQEIAARWNEEKEPETPQWSDIPESMRELYRDNIKYWVLPEDIYRPRKAETEKEIAARWNEEKEPETPQWSDIPESMRELYRDKNKYWVLPEDIYRPQKSEGAPIPQVSAPQEPEKKAKALKPESDPSAQRLVESGIVKTETSDPKGFVNQVIKWFKRSNMDFGTRVRAALVTRYAPWTTALRNQEWIDIEGQIRADAQASAFQQIFNTISTGYKEGIPVVGPDGVVRIVSDPNLALGKVLDRIDGLKQFNNPRHVVSAVLRALRGEEILKADEATRRQIASLRAKADTAEVASKAAKKREDIIKYDNEAKSLRKEAKALEETVGKMVGEGREKVVTQPMIDDARAILDYNEDVAKIVADMHNINRALVDLWENAGLVDAETATAWRDNPSYIPLYKSQEDILSDPASHIKVLGAGTKSVGEIKTLMGGTHEVNVLENMQRHYAFMTTAAAQNLLRKNASYQLERVGVMRRISKQEATNNPLAIMFKENGEKSYYECDDPVMFEAFQASIPLTHPFFTRFTQPMARFFRAATLVNPVFWYKQIIRDPIHASIVGGTGIITPLDAAAAFTKILRGKSETYKTLSKEGVVGAIDSLTDPKKFAESFERKKGTWNKFKDTAMRLHESADAATRVAVYDAAHKDAINRGYTSEKAHTYATMKAREVINFSNQGKSQAIQVIRATVPFFSAAINSLDVVARAASGLDVPPAERAAAKKMFYSRIAALSAMSAGYAMLMQDDEEYKKLQNANDWAMNWLIPTGNKQSPFIKVPVSFELGIPTKILPELWVRLNAGTLTAREAKKVALQAVQSALPPLPIPLVFKTPLETVMNYDLFTHRTIEGRGEENKLIEDRVKGASGLAKYMSKDLGLSGLGLSPAKIEHLGHGLGTELWAASTLLADAYLNKDKVTPIEPLSKTLPLAHSLLTKPDTERMVNLFYEIEADAKQMHMSMVGKRNAGKIEEFKADMADPEKAKLFRAEKPLRGIADNMAKISRQMERVKNTQTMTREEMTAELDRLKSVYNNMAVTGYQIAKKLGVD